MNRRPFLTIGLCALLAAALSALILRNGIQANSDAWTYWEGSVSLLEKGCYVGLFGEPIIAWPPLFSCYLSLAQAAGAQTGLCLILAVCALSALNVLAWGGFALQVSREEGGGVQPLAFWGSLTFVTLFVPLCGFMLLAQFLMLAWVGAAFWAILCVFEAPAARGYFGRAAVAGVLLCLALLSHNSALVFVGAAALALLLDRSRPLPARLAAALLVAALSALPWLAVREACGQMQSHPYSAPLFSPRTYLAQLLMGIGDFFLVSGSRLCLLRAAVGMGFALGLAAVLVPRGGVRAPRACRAAAVLVGASCLLLLVIFNLTLIGSGLCGRFLWHVPLAAVPVFLRLASAKPAALAVLLPLLLVSSAGRHVKYVLTRSLVAPLPKTADAPPDTDIRPWYFLTEKAPGAGPRGTRRVVPPSYPWMQRWQGMGLPEAEREKVRFAQGEAGARRDSGPEAGGAGAPRH